MSLRKHRQAGPASVVCAVLTVSDSRSEADDTSGRYLRAALKRAGHQVLDARILPDEPRAITRHLRWLARRGSAVQVMLVTGGTGLAARDTTFEAIAGLLEKRLDGFGEIFRWLSFRAIGPSAMLSRAVAGTFRGRMIVSMPGSEAAVRLAMRRLILPELRHVVGLLPPRR